MSTFYKIMSFTEISSSSSPMEHLMKLVCISYINYGGGGLAKSQLESMKTVIYKHSMWL